MVVWVCLFLLVLVELILLIFGGFTHVRLWDVIRMDTRWCLYVCCGKSLFIEEWYMRHSVLVTGNIYLWMENSAIKEFVVDGDKIFRGVLRKDTSCNINRLIRKSHSRVPGDIIVSLVETFN